MVDFYNDGNSLVDDSRAADIVYLDLRKASDTVSHDIIIEKLTK